MPTTYALKTYVQLPTTLGTADIPRAASNAKQASAAAMKSVVYQTRCARAGEPPGRCTNPNTAAQGSRSWSCDIPPRFEPDHAHGANSRPIHATPSGGAVSPPAM